MRMWGSTWGLVGETGVGEVGEGLSVCLGRSWELRRGMREVRRLRVRMGVHRRGEGQRR